MMSKLNPPWKGSPRQYPEPRLPASSESNQNHDLQAAVAGAHPLPEPAANMQPKQRRIGRSRRGVRVSRCLPTADSKLSGKRSKRRPRDSLMQVSGVAGLMNSPYWGALLPPVVTTAKHGQGQSPRAERRCREPSRVETIPGPVGCLTNGTSQANGDKENANHSKRLSQCPKKRPRKTRGGFVDPAAWVAVQRSLLQQRQLSSSVSRDQAVDEAASPPDIPSRSSSQQKTLNHFIRELDKYATAAGAARKLPVTTPTESASIVSLHTVRPLLPYLNEFQSAGLAVTSDQQRSKQLAGSNPRQSYRKPQSPKPIGDGHNGSPEHESGVNETCYVQFTPLDGTPKAPLVSSSSLKQKHEGSRRKLPWLTPNTAKSASRRSDTVAGPRIQLIKDGKIQKWKEPPNYLATQDADLLSRPPFSQKHGDHVQQMAHRNATPDAPPMSSEPHQPSTPLRREVAIPQLPLPESTGGTNASLKRDDMTCTLDESPIRTDPGSWLPRLPSRQLPGKRFGKGDASPAPEIPITWSRAVGSVSSLERALSAAIRDVGMKEVNTERRQEGTGQAKPTAGTINIQPTKENARRPGVRTYDPQNQPAISLEKPPGAILPAKSTNEELNVPSTRDKWKSPKEPAPTTTANAPSRSPHAEATNRIPRDAEQDDLFCKNAEKAIGDLGVPGNDHEDGDINDRNVLKGLQVAVQAAADEAFDTLIQDQTGLRIRRFLVDLKSVGGLDAASGDQRAWLRRIRMSRLTRERERKSKSKT